MTYSQGAAHDGTMVYESFNQSVGVRLCHDARRYRLSLMLLAARCPRWWRQGRRTAPCRCCTSKRGTLEATGGLREPAIYVGRVSSKGTIVGNQLAEERVD